MFAFLLAAMPSLALAQAQDVQDGQVAQEVPTVATEIRSAVGGKLKSFYKTRGYWPLWVHEDKIGPEADRLIALLESADLDGLDPEDYDPDKLRDIIAAAESGTPSALAKAEVALTKAFVDYVRDVRRPPSVKMVYLDKELKPERPSEAAVLRAAAIAPSFADHVKNAGWMSPHYSKLRDALGDYRKRWAKLPEIAIPAGPTLRAGAKGERVGLLRQRLGLPAGKSFDKALAAKVKSFQAAHGLRADGIAGEATIAALNRGPAHYERLIRLNLDRARILPSPSTRHIIVDVASARLWMYEDGKAKDMMRVVVGKPDQQTPMLAGMMRYVVLNPYWNLPLDLVRDSIARKVLAGRNFTAMGFEALSDWSAEAQRLDPAEIDWAAVAAGERELRVRQLPGKDNAMGKIKFMFPNDLGIYLHDTPDKHLFAKAERWFSSGCVRVQDASRLAKWLFGNPPKAQSDAPEQPVALPAAVPVYLTYLTAAAEGSGIVFRKDAYGRDGATPKSLASS